MLWDPGPLDTFSAIAAGIWKPSIATIAGTIFQRSQRSQQSQRSQRSQRSYGNHQSRRSLELFFSDRNNRSDLSDPIDHMETGLNRHLFGWSLTGGCSREVVLSGGLITKRIENKQSMFNIEFTLLTRRSVWSKCLPYIFGASPAGDSIFTHISIPFRASGSGLWFASMPVTTPTSKNYNKKKNSLHSLRHNMWVSAISC